MDDFYKIFGGYNNYKKLISHSSNMNSITALSSQVDIASWAQKSNEDLVLKAITGNTLQLWEALNKTPKTPDYIGMSELWRVNYSINNAPKVNPIFDSITSIAGKMNWLPSFANQSNPKNKKLHWSLQSLVGNSMIEVLSINDIFSKTNNLNNNIWLGSIYPQIAKEKKSEKEEEIVNVIERFSENVANVYSQVENFDEPTKNEFALNVNEVLTHETSTSIDNPTYFWVLEWVLNKYSEAIESALFEKNIDELKAIYNELKTKTIVGWVALILAIGVGGIIESKGGEIWEAIAGKEDVVETQIVYNTTISYNATTNNLKPLRIEPDGRTKVLLVIPDCTEVQLGEIIGKYIQVTLLHNGTVVRGWCLNKEFAISK